jgi:hypothetical protein
MPFSRVVVKVFSGPVFGANDDNVVNFIVMRDDNIAKGVQSAVQRMRRGERGIIKCGPTYRFRDEAKNAPLPEVIIYDVSSQRQRQNDPPPDPSR